MLGFVQVRDALLFLCTCSSLTSRNDDVTVYSTNEPNVVVRWVRPRTVPDMQSRYFCSRLYKICREHFW